MAQVELTLLEGFQGRCGAPPLSLSRRKAHALLAYLGLPPGSAHPQDKLAALLWRELPKAEAPASLRQALCSPEIPRPAMKTEGAGATAGRPASSRRQ
jgi:hypothetical protein